MAHIPKSVKLVALKLSTLTWLDRRLLLHRFDESVKRQIKQALVELNQLGIDNKRELLEQLLQQGRESGGLKSEVSSGLLHPDLQALLLSRGNKLTEAMHHLLESEVAKAVKEQEK